MLVNASNVKMIFVNLKTTFNNAFADAPSQWEKVATMVPSTSKSNDYAWLKKFPRMRKWIGDKVIKALEACSYTLTNENFEATIEVSRDDIEDDELGIYAPQAQDAGFSAKQWPDEIVFKLLSMAFKAKCYDGQPFISAKHQVGKMTYSNLGTAPLSIDTLAAAKAGYGAGRTQMRKFKDEDGRPLNVRPNLLIVPPALEDTANALMTTDRLEDGKVNPYKGTAEVLVVDYLESDTQWFLFDTSRPLKPLIFQQRKKPVFVSQTNPDSDDVFMRGMFKFGAEARGVAGFGFWQMAYGSTGAGA